jgi:hypothetical protein
MLSEWKSSAQITTKQKRFPELNREKGDDTERAEQAER